MEAPAWPPSYVGGKARRILLSETFKPYPESLGLQLFLPTFLLPPTEKQDRKDTQPSLPFASSGELGRSDSITQDGSRWSPAFSEFDATLRRRDSQSGHLALSTDTDGYLNHLLYGSSPGLDEETETEMTRQSDLQLFY